MALIIDIRLLKLLLQSAFNMLSRTLISPSIFFALIRSQNDRQNRSELCRVSCQ